MYDTKQDAKCTMSKNEDISLKNVTTMSTLIDEIQLYFYFIFYLKLFFI